MKKALVVMGIVACMLFVSLSVQAAVTNVALNADVQLEGAPFFTNGWGGGWLADASTVVDGNFFPISRQWDRGPVWWDSHDMQERSVVVDLGNLYVIESFIVQADDNDAYNLYYRDINTNTWVLAWAIPVVGGWGMQTRPNKYNNSQRYMLAAPIVTDTLLFQGNLYRGDRYFSVSEIQAFGEPYLITVAVDIKPDTDNNCVNLNGHGAIPVAILGSADLDVMDIDTSSVQLEGMGVKANKKGKLLAHYEDVNADGYTDLLVQIDDSDAALADDATTATVTGFLLDGTPIAGSDSICLVP